MKSILKKEYAIDKRIQRLRQLAEDRILVVERFREALERKKWEEHLKEEEIHSRSHYRNEYLERLQDEKAFKEEMYVIEKIIETEERKRRR